jgi:hypothetical protein
MSGIKTLRLVACYTSKMSCRHPATNHHNLASKITPKTFTGCWRSSCGGVVFMVLRMNKQFCRYVLPLLPFLIVPSGWVVVENLQGQKLHLVEIIFWSNPGVQKDKIITSRRSFIQFRSALDRLRLIFC